MVRLSVRVGLLTSVILNYIIAYEYNQKLTQMILHRHVQRLFFQVIPDLVVFTNPSSLVYVTCPAQTAPFVFVLINTLFKIALIVCVFTYSLDLSTIYFYHILWSLPTAPGSCSCFSLSLIQFHSHSFS